MKHSNIAVTAMLLALVLLCRVPPAQAESVSISEYRQQLHGIATKVDALGSHPDEAGELVASIPDHVSVATGAGEISVSYKTLKDNLAAFAAADDQKRPAILTQIQRYTRELLTAADGFDKRNTDLSSTQRKLDQILSRHEFKKVRGPSAKDAFLARVYRWLSRLLSKISFGAGTQFDWMRLLIYLLLGAAVVLLLIWTIRRLRRPQEDLPQREIIPFSPSARGWRTWLAEARALAQQQDWRNAIHLAYWAGISYLEEQAPGNQIAREPPRIPAPDRDARGRNIPCWPRSHASWKWCGTDTAAPRKQTSRRRWASWRNWGADEDLKRATAAC